NSQSAQIKTRITDINWHNKKSIRVKLQLLLLALQPLILGNQVTVRGTKLSTLRVIQVSHILTSPCQSLMRPIQQPNKNIRHHIRHKQHPKHGGHAATSSFMPSFFRMKSTPDGCTRVVYDVPSFPSDLVYEYAFTVKWCMYC